MRLLKVVVRGASLFAGDTFTMDFFASDRVSGRDGPAYNHVHRLGGHGSIYSQNVVGISGVNASGKSTALEIVRMALDLVGAPYYVRRDGAGRKVLAKIMGSVSVTVIFWREGSFYLLEAELQVLKTEDEEGGLDRYRIEDETIWRLTTPRPSKAMMGDIEAFKRNAEVFMQRHGQMRDGEYLLAEAQSFMGDHASKPAGLGAPEQGGGRFEPSGVLKTAHATAITRAFDSSVEHLTWDEGADAFRLKFFGEEEHMVSAEIIPSVLSHGTVIGISVVERALEQLRIGGFMLVDGIEAGLNRSLVKTLVELFQSHVSNPEGAQLVFTTHYVELLDFLPRKDDVYLLVRGKGHAIDVVKYSLLFSLSPIV